MCAPIHSDKHFSLCKEENRGGWGEALGAETHWCGHRWDAGSQHWAQQALLQPGSGHDPAAAQTPGLRQCAGPDSQHLNFV